MVNTLDETQYLKLEQARKMMGFCRQAWKELNGEMRPARDAFLVELGLSTGLRVAEMKDLQCRDLQSGNGMRSVVVRKGKGRKRRVVRLSEGFRKQCIRFMKLKASMGEPTDPEDPVFFSRQAGKALSRRSLQRAFKRISKVVGFPAYYSIHALRHTYGTQLCRASGNNLKLVQQLMGHSSIKSTEVYLHVEDDTIDEAVENHTRLLTK